MSYTDGDLAAKLADEAGKILLSVRGSGLFGGKALGKAGDQTANQFLCHALREQRPEDGLLSEEEKDNAERLAMSRVWIVDPVDGTREYGEERADWAVHVGLAVDGVPVLGAVALPGADLVLRSDQPGEVPPAPEKLRMVVSRTRPAKEATSVAETIGAELVPMGSAGAKAMAILLGQADIYLHSGGQYEWDSCAPAAVALGWGLHVSRIDGSPLVYNREDVYMPDLLICRKEHADMVLREVAALV
ncbi:MULTISPECIES: 3'(2'),5'-bisphosphate nucleotidase CysQ [Sphingomonadaceae]|jgi:3'(2'), 5'-bisphosphate nucleotidase|uniref:3'(2'),5'-bisphosphate nucleotidase CysQ n=1 Tax=Novosphingobium resinovorum TaxID=158500 RepID=A0A031K054_9SPHN|nr:MULTISPECIES: 3'(2'),5'-bisphosphate nucleotidase CysQ [Sphingomonadaceae]AOR76173.1 3'(2'),5'-bisphosphate nucleotidase CysQ [Novosphingobium resinovorum]EJU12317.1 inositol monophosphatase [Sphingomonas sp. LH128]EZP83326.1 Inositol monophosphatase [Novosphingobium resinovorum]MBF7011576.1 3'(2'),5'-bisphosphate nucleotidase CysQ [Novosphingobium sp. HR1a]WJM29548.1 3'(2'),5'-bisphosphate nucleotidase CysQ [Novosphingobium resinovorum]